MIKTIKLQDKAMANKKANEVRGGALNFTKGADENQILIGLLLPAVQKVREAAR